MLKTVVVSGMGVVSPIGNNLSEFREALRAGKSGEGQIQRFDTSSFPIKKACEVKNFKPGWRTSLLDPFIQYSFAAAEEAVQDAGINLKEVDPYRIGIVMGSSKGGMVTFEQVKEKYGDTLPSALHTAAFYASFPPHMGAQWLAKRHKVKGPAKCFTAACSTGTYSIIDGAQMVADGEVDYCMAGSSDASITKMMLAAYRNMKAHSKNEKMRPYDVDRDGFLIGEGSGMVFLESEESAKARGAKIYAKIIASSFGGDGVSLIHYDERAHGLSSVVDRAFKSKGLKPSDMDYVSMHGTSTVAGDRYEVNEIKHLFKSSAEQIPMSSIKSMTGHMLGAGGSVEFIASCLSISEGWVPPTIHLDNVEEGFDLDFVPNQMREKKVGMALSFSLAFGGQMGAIVVSK